MIVTERERERGRDTAEGEAGSMHREPDVGLDPGDPGSNPTSGSRCMEPASPSAYVSLSLSSS